MIIRAFEGILKLFKRQRLNLFFNQIVELLSYIFVDFAVFSWFIEGLIAGAVDLGEHEVVGVGILIVFVIVQRLGLGQSGVVEFGVYKGQDWGVFVETAVDLAFEQFQNYQLKNGLFLRVVQNYL